MADDVQRYSKCRVMHFGKKITTPITNGQRLLTATERKDLGVVISLVLIRSHLNGVFKTIQKPVE